MIIHATKVTFKCLAVEKGHALHSIPMQSSNQKNECYVTFPHWKAYMPLCLWNYCTCFDIFSLLFIYSSKQHDTAVFILARGWCWTELHDSRANNEILFVSTIVYWYFTFSIITFSIYKTMDIIWTIQASTSQLKHLTWSQDAHYSLFLMLSRNQDTGDCCNGYGLLWIVFGGDAVHVKAMSIVCWKDG